MNFTQIDLLPLLPGYGMIWQGGLIDAELSHLPAPLVIVGMTAASEDANWLLQSRARAPGGGSTGSLQGVLSVQVADMPTAMLPDAVYLGLVDACIGYLRHGVNLYIHCRMGLFPLDLSLGRDLLAAPRPPRGYGSQADREPAAPSIPELGVLRPAQAPRRDPTLQERLR